MARRSDHSREELYDLALESARVIAEIEGLRGLAARRIARDIGYTVGTIYNLFDHGAGDAVVAGEPVCILEAMKMENEIKSPNDGEIVDLRVQPGDTVAAGAVLMVIR